MGKAKPRFKNKRKQGLSQPTGLPSVQDAEKDEEDEMTSKDSEEYLNVIEEIQSADVETKLCGLRSLLALTELPQQLDRLLGCNVLKIIAPFLVEKNSEVRNLTSGVLRNMSACGGVRVSARLVKDDIMTPLLAVLAQYGKEWRPEACSAEDGDTLLQLTNTLWNLCEADETALGRFNCAGADVLGLLLRCVRPDLATASVPIDLATASVPIDLAIAAAHCLNAVSENNPVVASVLRGREADLLSLLAEPATTHRRLLLTTLLAGLVGNVWGWVPAVLSAIAASLSVDARSAVCRLSSDLPPSGGDLDLDLESRLVEVTALVQAQTVALETLANVASAADDDMEVESGSGEDDEEEWEGEGEGESRTEETQPPLGLDPTVGEALVGLGLVEAVLAKTEPLPLNVADILAACPSARQLANKCAVAECRALLCLNNLVSGLGLEDLGGAERLYRAAGQITAQRLAHPHPQSGEVLEAASAAVRAIMLRLAQEKFTGVNDVQPAHLQVLIDVSGRSEDDRVRANVARAVAALGTMLLDTPDATGQPLLQMVGAHLLATVEGEGGAWLACEALDCLVDLYGDDRTDRSAAHLRLVPRLRAVAPRLKAKVRSERGRRRHAEHSAVVATAMANLGPFLKYKAQRLANQCL